MLVFENDTSTYPYFSSLFGTVHCPFSPRELVHTSPVHPNPWCDKLCHHKPHYIFPQNSHHTYQQGISIAFLRYIVMQHPPSHDLIFMSYMYIAMWGPLQYRTWLVYSNDEPPQMSSRSS